MELHPTKTKKVYCQDKDRKKEYSNTEFDFLGYTFRKRWINDRLGRAQAYFIASVSKKAEETLKVEIKAWKYTEKQAVRLK